MYVAHDVLLILPKQVCFVQFYAQLHKEKDELEIKVFYSTLLLVTLVIWTLFYVRVL